MSQQLINRSPDLLRLRNEGYDVEVRSNYLLIKNVPYVTSGKEVTYGTLVSELTLAGDVTTTPSTHVALFAGEYPCNRDGSQIAQIMHQSVAQQLDQGLAVQHSFSSKPAGGYKDYYDKMSTYAAIISSPAESLDPAATPKAFRAIASDEAESPFHYIDTATSRAGTSIATRKLEGGKIGIVGLGGTGSYVLDLVAKAPVAEIHLFDGDRFSQHNAFRAPGAPSIEELRDEPQKVAYFQKLYSRMHRRVVAHDMYIDPATVDRLRGLDFVFLCLDRGGPKRLAVEKLEELGTPFVDVGMGVQLVEDALIGVLRVTASTASQRDHVRSKGRIPFSNDGDNDYAQNIQIADLNALNAALAVIRWKKLRGFYVDYENEHHTTYTVDGNMLTNEDKA